MPKSGPSGFVRGARGNARPYRDFILARMLRLISAQIVPLRAQPGRVVNMLAVSIY